ncbi:hypothetical protein LSTR_LSTR008983 [Laodelphax striatellus]|uniref:Receptor ligand binding region domain-containing protein n=1 Tax=Laodelphax striatellus TaxID=195883 RepID=A0A482WYZ0_LAOST|nr:hypothetical protein LSTR_LSTR008983 [Laodelphax striatellus]
MTLTAAGSWLLVVCTLLVDAGRGGNSWHASWRRHASSKPAVLQHAEARCRNHLTMQPELVDSRPQLAAAGQLIDPTKEVRAAVILPGDWRKYDLSLGKVMPVLQLAESAVHSRGLLPGHRFRFIASDDRCEAVYAQYRSVEAYAKDKVHVFFGPSCEYSVAPVARMVKFWGTPLLTTGAMTFDFSRNKTDCEGEYHLLVRVGLLSFRDMALFLIALLDEYKWTKVMLLYDKDGCEHISGKHTCKLMMGSLLEFMDRDKFTVRYYNFENISKDAIQEDLRREIGYQFSIYKSILTNLTNLKKKITTKKEEEEEEEEEEMVWK